MILIIKSLFPNTMGFPFSSKCIFFQCATSWCVLGQLHRHFPRHMLAPLKRDTWQFKLELHYESWVTTGLQGWHFLLGEVQGLDTTDMVGQDWNALAGLRAWSLHGSTWSKPVQPGHHLSICSQSHRQLWEQSKKRSKCWCKDREQHRSEVSGMGLLLEGGVVTQNGAGDRPAWSQRVMAQNEAVSTPLGGGQKGARLVDCRFPLGCSKMMLVPRIRETWNVQGTD